MTCPGSQHLPMTEARCRPKQRGPAVHAPGHEAKLLLRINQGNIWPGGGAGAGVGSHTFFPLVSVFRFVHPG